MSTQDVFSGVTLSVAEENPLEPTNIFNLTPAVRALMTRFKMEHFESFPDIPCSFCGVLSLPRVTTWQIYNPECIKEYELYSVLGVALMCNIHGLIAVCQCCAWKPRHVPDVGPLPEEVLRVPQRWRQGACSCGSGRF